MLSRVIPALQRRRESKLCGFQKPADGIEYFDPSENDDDDESRTNVPSSSSAGDTTCEASGSSNTTGQPSTRVISTYR